MVLVDSSVWIEHFRKGEPTLAALLNDAAVLMHPFVLGELACGDLKSRDPILESLSRLPNAVAATHDETLQLIERQRLWDCGIGGINAHLVASALLTNCHFWTLDSRLKKTATAAGVKA